MVRLSWFPAQCGPRLGAIALVLGGRIPLHALRPTGMGTDERDA
jgi:hypothetical protein